MSLFDGTDLDRDHFIEGCLVVAVAILIVIFIYALCCHAKKKAEKRRKKQEEEEATSFFTLDDMDPPARSTSYKSTVFTLGGVTRLYAPLGQPYFSCAEIPCCPPQTYITIAQAPVTLDQFNGDLSPGPVLLGPGKGQHVSTPIYPPSYFGPSSACYTSLSDVNPSLAAPLKP